MTCRGMRDLFHWVPPRCHRFNHVLAVQYVKIELRTEPLDAPFKRPEGSNVDLYALTCDSLESHGQNRVRLTALRVGQEEDPLGVCTGVVVSGAHSGTNAIRGLRCKGCLGSRRRVRAGYGQSVGVRRHLYYGFVGFSVIQSELGDQSHPGVLN